MIPPEIIALISSHALMSFSAYARKIPTLLEIPSSFIITRYPDLCDIRPPNRQASAKPVLLAKQAIEGRQNIADALQAAMTSGIEPMSLDHHVNNQEHNPENGVPLGNRILIPKTSLSLSVSMNIPTSATFHTSSITSFSDIPKPSSKLHDLLSPLNGALKHIRPPSARDPHSTLSFSTWVSESVHCASSPHPTSFPSHFAIGNLFLSSCPGKKGILRLYLLICHVIQFLCPS